MIIAVDTETFRFGPGNVIPDMICTSWAWKDRDGIHTDLVSDGDGGKMHDLWQELLESDHMLVFLNAAYDLNVCAKTYPDLEPLIWAKLRRGEVDDVGTREKLLALSSHGFLRSVDLPDGTKKQLNYDLASLAKDYLGTDRTEDKGEDSVRTHYDLYTGLPAEKYPAEAKRYAKLDAYDTIGVYYGQEPRIQSEDGRFSCSTSHFRAAVSFALLQITANGMRTNRPEFERIRAEMEKVLAESNLDTIIRAGILRPAKPVQVAVRSVGKALALLEEWGVEAPISKWAGVKVPVIEGKARERKTWKLSEAEIMPEGAIAWWELDREVIDKLKQEVTFKKPDKMTIDTKMLAWTVKDICKQTGSPVKYTEKGGICCDSEVIGELEGFSPSISNYQYYQEQQKIVSTELPGMMWPNPKEDPDNADLAPRIHFGFNELVSTGRTSSYASKHYPSRNGQQIDPRVRPCYLPEEGMWLLSNDYSSLELCSVGQTTFELFGASRHRDLINNGYDLHAFLGAMLARRLSNEFEGHRDPFQNYELFKQLKASDAKDDNEFFGHWRKFAKPVGLGYPGGLGAKTFISLAKKTYKVDIIKAALEMPENQLEVNSTVLWHAARIGITEDEFRWTPFLKGVALAKMLKDVWLETYPEMVEYFEWVVKQNDGANFQENDDGEKESKLCYTTPLGMHRSGATYTACANGKAMQSPSAEGFCTAIFHLQEATRIGDTILREVIFHDEIHDEMLASVPGNQEGAWQAVCAIQDMMEDCMGEILPDVRISTEAALSLEWRKKAEPVYDQLTGMLVPWEPDVQYVKTSDGTLYLPLEHAGFA